MKKLFILFVLLFSLCGASFAQEKPQRGMANYYLQDPDRYLDNSVTIYALSFVKTKAPAPDGYTEFMCFTSSNNASKNIDGGNILVYIRKLREKTYMGRETGWIINGKPSTTPVGGKFIKAVDGNGYAVKMN